MKAKDKKKARDILQQAEAEEETGRQFADADGCRQAALKPARRYSSNRTR